MTSAEQPAAEQPAQTFYCFVPIQALGKNGQTVTVTTPWGTHDLPAGTGANLTLEDTVKVTLTKPVNAPNNTVVSVEPLSVKTTRVNTTEGRKTDPKASTEAPKDGPKGAPAPDAPPPKRRGRKPKTPKPAEGEGGGTVPPETPPTT